ncbi:MAG TPA: SIS domain-containing protein [Chloroflexota bacterium]|nr:SIS domain-containing protein [Chloroflexota bacterium]
MSTQEKPTSALYATIHSQPSLIRSVLDGASEWLPRATELLSGARRIFLAGTGTSSHAAVVGEHLLRAAGLDAYATTNFDFVTYPRPLHDDDALIIFSHRGSKTFGNLAIERGAAAGIPVIGITGQDSPMAGPNLVIATAPQEKSATHTASYTANLAAMAAIAVALGEQRGEDMSSIGAGLHRVPEAMEAMLERENELRLHASALAGRKRLVLAGAGPNAVTAKEGALKIKESCFITAEGFELETLLHGGLQAVHEGDLAVVIAANGPAIGRTGDAARALSLIGTQLVLVADESIAGIIAPPGGAMVVGFPSVPEQISPMLAVLPLQLLAAFTSQALRTNPDAFRADESLYKNVNASYKL